MAHTTQAQFYKVTVRHAWGVAAVTQRLANARFPCTKATLLRHFEQGHEVDWSETLRVDVRELIAAMDQARFDDVHEVAAACQRAAMELGYGDGGKKPGGAEP